jgi:hypothetical protein
MITPKTFLIQINELLGFLLNNGIAIDFNSAIVRESNHNSIITWANAPKNIFDTLIGRFASLTEYRNLLQNRLYHCMLYDGSLIQFGYLFNDDELVKHRNCFYPCPLSINPLEIKGLQPGDDFVTLFDYFLDQEADEIKACISTADYSRPQELLRLSTPFRFDFDPNTQLNNHPASHLHIIDGDCRLPIFGPLSVGHFVRFIFHHFYPQIWSEYDVLRNWTLDFHSRSITPQEQGELFIECHEADAHC